MKLRNKLAIITSAATLAFVGAGFAAWTFTTTVDDSANATAKVTCGIEATGLKVYNGANEIDNLYVIFDAPTVAAGNRKAGAGIFYSAAANGSEPITTLRLVGEISHIANDLHYGDTAEQVEFTVDEDNQMPAAQVNFTAGSIASATQPVVAGTNEYEATYTLPALDYVAAPTSMAELGAFKDAVNGATIALDFTFGIAA